MKKTIVGGVIAAGTLLLMGSVAVAEPEVVSGPASDPQCFVPWDDGTKFYRYPAKEGPFRIALANGYIANTWRIQMIQTAKAYAEQPDVAAKLAEFKVVSTGEDVPAQISAINNFIDSGYDAIVVNAQNPTAFGPVIRRAKEAGVILVAFDNILDTEDAINVNVDQKGLGVLWANWLDNNLPDGGKILEVRGVAGTSVDTDRHNGIHETFGATGKNWEVVEVVGRWDDATAQKATADAIDAEVRAIVDTAFERAVALLTERRELLEKTARRLLEKETLDEAELSLLLVAPGSDGNIAAAQATSSSVHDLD